MKFLTTVIASAVIGYALAAPMGAVNEDSIGKRSLVDVRDLLVDDSIKANAKRGTKTIIDYTSYDSVKDNEKRDPLEDSAKANAKRGTKTPIDYTTYDSVKNN
ncbi:hypothetical protein G6011_06878 [Alternaria panax]|uniref:Uncharacterized protein n=1 Tax=Alternaria panax TaxID=48097 RepID=A0AAD4I503_9PLEO|nr:hypothetical protein G6011_06878 [Alternaria panax]